MGWNDEHMSKFLYDDNLKFIRKENLNKLIVTHLNINSIRNKFGFLLNKIKGNVDVITISETKLDNTFPNRQILIDAFYEPIRIDINKTIDYCVTLLRKATKEYYGSLDEKHVIDNKTFRKTVKPFLSDKTVNFPKVTLVKRDKTINNEDEITETFDAFFPNFVSNLKIPLYQDTDFPGVIDLVVGDDPIILIFEKYKTIQVS